MALNLDQIYFKNNLITTMKQILTDAIVWSSAGDLIFHGVLMTFCVKDYLLKIVKSLSLIVA